MDINDIENVVNKSLDLCYTIGRCGCSEQLTEASIKASEVYSILEKYLEQVKRDN